MDTVLTGSPARGEHACSLCTAKRALLCTLRKYLLLDIDALRSCSTPFPPAFKSSYLNQCSLWMARFPYLI